MKPFFYRINAAELLSEVVQMPESERGSWILQLAIDLVSANPTFDYSASIIEKSKKNKEIKSLAGKKGMENRYSKPNTVITEPNTVITEMSFVITEPNTVITEVNNDITELEGVDFVDEKKCGLVGTDVALLKSLKDLKDMGGKNKIPPPLDEVKKYCAERNRGVDPDKWFNFYQGKGWMVGKNKMKDWQAAIRTWEKPLDYTPERPIF